MNRRTISDLRVWSCIRLQHSQVHPSHRIPRLFLKIFQRRLGGPVVWVPGQGNTIKSSNIVSVAQGLQHSQAHPSLRITRRFLRYLQRRLGDLWCGSKANSSAVALSALPMGDWQSPMGDAVVYYWIFAEDVLSGIHS